MIFQNYAFLQIYFTNTNNETFYWIGDGNSYLASSCTDIFVEFETQYPGYLNITYTYAINTHPNDAYYNTLTATDMINLYLCDDIIQYLIDVNDDNFGLPAIVDAYASLENDIGEYEEKSFTPSLTYTSDILSTTSKTFCILNYTITNTNISNITSITPTIHIKIPLSGDFFCTETQPQLAKIMINIQTNATISDPNI